MKLKYRKHQLQHIISTMEQDKRKCGTQLLNVPGEKWNLQQLKGV